MKPQNLKLAAAACRELEQLKHHHVNFSAIMTNDLQEDQYELQKNYLDKLGLKIKKLEKDISEL